MPTRRNHFAMPSRLRGAALLVMLVVMVLGIAALLVGSLNNATLRNARDAQTSTVLAQAKEALIGYAVTYADTHSGFVDGYLPCPDVDGSNGLQPEGSAEYGTNSVCTNSSGNHDVSSIGRLPWKTLDLAPLRDGYGECLWYAVSGTYKNNPKTSLMNWDNRGLLDVSDAGGSSVNDVVAIIFAPGPPLTGQDRTASGDAPICGGNYTASNYLDHDGTHDNASVSSLADDISHFFSGSSAQFNDRLIYITRQDIWNAMLKRHDFMNTLQTMTQKAAECLADYGRRNYYGTDDKRLPWSGRLLSPSSDYKTDSNYDDEDGRLVGRLPYRVNSSDNDTYNLISYPYYQLVGDGSNCPDVGTDWQKYYPWWDNWKDHLYYAVSSDYSPNSHDTSCGTCVSVNGHGHYAGVVIFAGQALSGQSRATDSDRLNIANYLDGRNYTNFINGWTWGHGDFQSGTESNSFDDILYCINPDLTVTPC